MSSETFIYYITTWCHIPEDHDLNLHRRKNLTARNVETCRTPCMRDQPIEQPSPSDDKAEEQGQTSIIQWDLNP